MGIEEFKDFLDINKVSRKIGQYSPVYIFAYLSYVYPSIHNFIFLVISIIFISCIPAIKSRFKSISKDNDKVIGKLLQKKNTKALYLSLVISHTYWFLLVYSFFHLLVGLYFSIKLSGVIIFIISFSYMISLYSDAYIDKKNLKIYQKLKKRIKSDIEKLTHR